jgi:hypothetical protein
MQPIADLYVGAAPAPTYKSAIGCNVVLIVIGVLVYNWTRAQ